MKKKIVKEDTPIMEVKDSNSDDVELFEEDV